MKKIWSDSKKETKAEDNLTRKVDNGGDVIALYVGSYSLGSIVWTLAQVSNGNDLKSQIVFDLIL